VPLVRAWHGAGRAERAVVAALRAVRSGVNRALRERVT